MKSMQRNFDLCDPENLVNLFPVKKSFAYFVTAGAGPLSKPAFEAMQKFSELSMNTGAYHFSDWLQMVPNMGSYSLSEPFNYTIQDYSETLQRLNPEASRFEEACPNFLALVALKANLELILLSGVEQISKRIKQLTDRLIEGLISLGYPIISLRHDDFWSGIVWFKCKTASAAEIKENLLNHGVLISSNDGGLRVSVHFFNDESEIDRLLSILAILP